MRHSADAHQALFGYDAGHNLLVSSLELSAASKRLLLRLTDLSGPQLVSGFGEYITGYPLVDQQYYCLAKTWYAEEKPRPGSVWTHCLLIPYSLLGNLSDPYALTHYFARPNPQQRAADSYAQPIVIDSQALDAIPLPTAKNANPERIKSLVYHLYSAPETCLLVPAKDGLSFAQDLFHIWSQQWPKLRREFAFCTGAIQPREIEEKRFDVQVVPRTKSSLDRQNYKVVDVAAGIDLDQHSSPSWLGCATHDIISATESDLRGFLRFVGPTVDDGRSHYPRLVTLYDAARQTTEPDPRFLLHTLCAQYPSKEQAPALKARLLDSTSNQFAWETISDTAILFAVAVQNDITCIPSEAVDIEARLERIGATSDAGLDLVTGLLGKSLTDLGQTIVRESCERLPLEKFLTHIGDATALLHAATLSPTLLIETEFWDRAAEIGVQELLNAGLNALISQTNPDPAELTAAVVRSEFVPVAAIVLRQLGPMEVITTLLDMVSSEEVGSQTLRWAKDLVQDNWYIAEHWLDRQADTSPALLRFIAEAVPDGSGQQINLSVFHRHLETLKQSVGNWSDRTLVKCLFVAEHESPAAATVAAVLSQELYRRLCRGKLSDGAWNDLRKKVPLASWIGLFSPQHQYKELVDQIWRAKNWPAELLNDALEPPNTTTD